MTQQLEGTFKPVSWDEKQYDAAAGQPKFTHARGVHELAGSIDGEVSICYLMVYRPDQSANFVGLATVTGSIDGYFLRNASRTSRSASSCGVILNSVGTP